MKQIPTDVTKIDAKGKRIVERSHMQLLPPRKGLCSVCAVDHVPQQAHNAQSLYYGVAFLAEHGRSPTWADAVAHCDEDLRKRWKDELMARKAWTEPPAGQEPIAQPYSRQE